MQFVWSIGPFELSPFLTPKYYQNLLPQYMQVFLTLPYVFLITRLRIFYFETQVKNLRISQEI